MASKSLIIIGAFVLLACCGMAWAALKPCHDIVSVSLKDGTRLKNGSILYDGLVFPPSSQYKSKGQLYGCPCLVKNCIRRCCPAGMYDDAGCHEPFNRTHNVGALPPHPDGFLHPEIENFDEHFYVIYRRQCLTDYAFALLLGEPALAKKDHFQLLPNGTISHYNENSNDTYFYEQERFCLAWSENKTSTKIRTCLRDDETQALLVKHVMLWIKAACNWMSALFCVLTFLVYALFPELRNLHGKALMCYVVCRFATDVLIPFIRTSELQNNLFNHTGCVAMAYIVHFSFLASFFWLNVMCFDIWWTFGGFRSLHGSVKQRERKKFIMYSIYAWGCATILTAVCMFMDLMPGIPPDIIRPEFGVNSCWYKEDYARAIYFYGPMGVTVLCNICLFVITAVKISRHQKDTARQLKGSESKRHDDNKQWFNLYLKLFIVMGINWSMEIISWVFDRDELNYLWFVTDLANTLQGVVIFLIFVWKDKIKRLLLARFGFENGRWVSRNSTTRNGCPNSSLASRATCVTTSAPLQEKPSFAPDAGSRGKTNAVCTDTESDCV